MSQGQRKAAAKERHTLQAMGLEKSFRRRKVVNDIHIEVSSGEIVGLLGPNGAGKTTTFYMIAGVIQPDRGQIFLNGENITQLPIHRRARRGLGYLPQERSVFRRLSVQDNLLAVLEQSGIPAAERRDRLELGLTELGLTQIRHSRGYQLSGGESRRVEIARALVLEPSFLLLDEPFAGVDPISVIEIQHLIKHLQNLGIGVLITDHNVRETLKICDRAYILSEGAILTSGTPSEILANPDVRRVYLGHDFTL